MTTPLPPITRGPRARPSAFTLVELLVAATIALVIMAALTSLFGIFSRAVSDSEELVRLAARMRATSWRLRQDLGGLTTEVRPYIRPENAAGYLEIIEGPVVEATPLPGSTVGDTDDILMLTTASPSRPFSGLIALTTPTTTAVQTVNLESDVAEVVWFCKQGRRTDDGVQLFNLYRRQLLVSAAPGVGMMATTSTTVINSSTTTDPMIWDIYFRTNDLSVRREGNVLIANSLADLTRRHARFMHNVTGATGTNFMSPTAPSGVAPHTVSFACPQITTTSTITGASDILTGPREGEDLILANVISFDVRVFDPQQATAQNAYVDLGASATGTSVLAANANVMLSISGVPLNLVPTTTHSLSTQRTVARITPGRGTNLPRLYDTWSLHTEWNNIADMIISTATTATANLDRGTNLVDDNGNGVVDDVAELEQPGPYSVPLRGVEIRIRCYDPSSKEVRQVTVQHSFLAR